ncbi:MAG: hypothetical protein H0U40_08905 [Chloroflexia bacterium]|nr:hypothetical protein [Chloroflexia bacterium]
MTAGASHSLGTTSTVTGADGAAPVLDSLDGAALAGPDGAGTVTVAPGMDRVGSTHTARVWLDGSGPARSGPARSGLASDGSAGDVPAGAGGTSDGRDATGGAG